MDLRAVDVLPAHVQDAAVGQDPGRVIVVVVAGQHPQVGTIGVATVQRGHPAVPAIDKPPAAAGAEHDPAVRQVSRLDVVVGPVRQLRQPRPVDIDFVQVIRRGAAPAIGKQDLLAVVMHLRIAHAAQRVVEQHRQLTGAQVQPAQPASVAVAAQRVAVNVLAKGIVRWRPVVAAVIAEAHVPVIASRHPHGKHNLVDAPQVAVQHRLQQRSGLVGRRFVCCGRETERGDSADGRQTQCQKTGSTKGLEHRRSLLTGRGPASRRRPAGRDCGGGAVRSPCGWGTANHPGLSVAVGNGPITAGHSSLSMCLSQLH